MKWTPAKINPPDNGKYIVTESPELEDDFDFCFSSHSFWLDVSCIYWLDGAWKTNKGWKVLAWAELPAPYKEDETT